MNATVNKSAAGAGMHRWWDGLPGQYFWLEITRRDRTDLGVDLNAPRQDETGGDHWSYALLREASDGDIVFHFYKPDETLVGYSVVRGAAWEDTVLWGARGTGARDRGIQPYLRPGWRRGLQHFTTLSEPLTLEDIRAKDNEVLAIRHDLEQTHGRPVYFPFWPYRGQSVRPAEGYMAKLPVELVRLLGLPEVPADPDGSPGPRPPFVPRPGTTSGGAPYRYLDEDVAVSTAEPMQIDPSLVERALRGHRATQNKLASLLEQAGCTPLRPAPGDPDWDLAWQSAESFYVVEVKTVTPRNEERQLRLGLGQVLRYRHSLLHRHAQVVAVLAVDRQPVDPDWGTLCKSLGVVLAWPENWSSLVA